MKPIKIFSHQPLRDVALNQEELQEHAKKQARLHLELGAGPMKSIKPRVKENMRHLHSAYEKITDYVHRTKDLVPAAEWFLDNYYRLKDLDEEINQNLPRGYERRLFPLGGGDYQGMPRIMALMTELVKHTDSQLQVKTLREYINAYQTVIPLSSAEIWAVPIVLRVILLENIRRLAEEILYTQEQRAEAELWFTPIEEKMAENNDSRAQLPRFPAGGPYSSTFVERLSRRLRELGTDGKEILAWLDREITRQGGTVEAMVGLEHQKQAACQVSMGHAIVSLQFLDAQNWPTFFEEISCVERLLQTDPGQIYPQMDFDSRDVYRHRIEKLARKIKVSELSVAQKVIEKAQGRFDPKNPVTAHIGYDLFRGFKSRAGIRKYARTGYFISIFVGLALLIFLTLTLAAPRRGWEGLLIACLSLIPLSGIMIAAANAGVTRLVTPAFLPKLDFGKGIPEQYRTMIVIPTLLPSPERVKELFAQLEVYYLSNQDACLHFALLGDFVDADAPEVPNDRAVIAEARRQLEALQQKYGQDRFYFFHRSRQWNDAEQVWMGWERKRGKLLEFNRLLLGDEGTSYYLKLGDLSVLPHIRYVITLDADTQLPRDGARKLIGVITHPLQAPVLSADGKRVEQGYGIIQPRIGISVLVAEASTFARMFSGSVGIDPYTKAISDVYQDIFGEGIFTGKGIYDVRVFHRLTGQAFPENIVLSHDLLEGLYARTGLASDIELLDGYPAKYFSYMNRLHRWVRGDWQLIRWLKSDLPFQGKWKIVDNLRRSLEGFFQYGLLCLGIGLWPSRAWLWCGIVLLGLIWPSMVSLFPACWKRGEQEKIRTGFREGAVQTVWQFLMLPYQAFAMADAITRSLYRQYVSHKNLLEWQAADHVEKNLVLSLSNSYYRMAPGWVTSLLIAALLFAGQNPAAPLFAAFTLLWLIGPWWAYRASLPLRGGREKLSPGQSHELRLLARRTWGFFEQFVNQEEHFLPPDNVQVDPPKGVAHRTSPTNIGLSLLANLSAWDLGYLTVSAVLERTEKTLDTLEILERWNGHLYNWYNTRDLTPLHPLYVSSVDSGNLVVYLLTLQSGLKELSAAPLLEAKHMQGLKDTFDVFYGHLKGKEKKGKVDSLKEELEKMLDSEDLDWQHFRTGLARWAQWLEDFAAENAPLASEAQYWCDRLQAMMAAFGAEMKGGGEGSAAGEVGQRVDRLLARLNDLIYGTKFDSLYDAQRGLFSIGYKVEEGKLDSSYYDLLASEARQASFIAIAKGDVPQSHWFRLGRSLTKVDGKRSLVSWSGTMFEFLMPLLIMRNYPRTLLDETYRSVVEIQRLYGRRINAPWGVSESGFHAFDAQLNYQYKAFGVPGLGLKRGLIQDRVIAPYATMLALMVDPPAAYENIERMKKFSGRFGLYEAIDFTPERLRTGEKYRVVQSFMAHHQGMSLLALTNILQENCLQRRFHAHAMIQGAELLLQERLPSMGRVVPPPDESPAELENYQSSAPDEGTFVTLDTPHTVLPVTHLIGNGRYSVMLTNAGSGYSRFEDLAVTRWREDGTADGWGMYFYIQNLNSGDVWSAAYQPCLSTGEGYKLTCAPDRVEYFRKDGNISTRTEVVVSPEDQVEIRRISLTNYSQYVREVEITSYLEVVLGRQGDDAAHPAFAKLFVQTEFHHQALIAYRRPRQEKDTMWHMMHTLALEGEEGGAVQYETDRMRFIGRGKSLVKPQALEPNQPLSNTAGTVLDPILSLRQRVCLPPGKTVRLSFSTGIADNREEILALAEKYRDPSAVQRAFELAWTHSQMELRHLNLTAGEANRASILGSGVLYLDPQRRERAGILQQNRLDQSALWPFGISGDLPIVLVKVESGEHLQFVRQLTAVHEYWRLKGLFVDLVLLNGDRSGYMQAFQDALQDLVSMSKGRSYLNKPGGIFLLQEIHLPPESLILLQTAARLVFDAKEGSWPVQVRRKIKATKEKVKAPAGTFKGRTGFPAFKTDLPAQTGRTGQLPEEMAFFNGIGGFGADGREYIIKLDKNVNTPLPWINVLANPQFGCLVSEKGSGYTWALNSRENKLTPWFNDPILDPPGEALYLRDEGQNAFWSPLPGPVREEEEYVVRHGQGYSRFTHTSHALEQEVTVCVPLDAPVKLVRLRMRNLSMRRRKLSATYYAEWVLGVARELTAPYIVTELEREKGAVLAYNTYQKEFSGRVAVLRGFGGAWNSATGDRREFIGRNGTLAHPQGMNVRALSGQTGPGLDPCAALRLSLDLEGGEERTVLFLVGEGESREEALDLTERYADPERFAAALKGVRDFWEGLLGQVQVETPDPACNVLLNRWLLYQTLACRIWARSAFYQSGGAFGFRDQLQDALALIAADPEYTRRQILLHAAHQFVEGDVQHWWHKEDNKGIRTKFSDDLLWLPYAVIDYLEWTGDDSLLRAEVNYLQGEALGAEENERYDRHQVAEEKGSIYEHCVRAIEKGARFGEHGLPLIGSGDWNDGFSRVGRAGKGESVWLGWFLYVILKRFAPICRRFNEEERAQRYEGMAEDLLESLERYGWDGGWYRRAYFDDGTPMGSAANAECQIDAIAQAWAVLSGAAKETRAADAMMALENYLWRKDEGMMLLLTPPFDHSLPDPGYIRGYVPGVRENGGQYTHGAIWAVLAYVKMGDGERAWNLFQQLNPINHSRTMNEANRYKTEPYVMAADVYATGLHTGRGGWSWYTGAAGWMYQAGLYGILGFGLHQGQLRLSPCIPKHWDGYKIKYHYRSACYVIVVKNPEHRSNGVKEAKMDGKVLTLPDKGPVDIPLADDRATHVIDIIL